MENIKMKFTGHDFLQIEDNEDVYEILSSIRIDFYEEGYSNIPDVVKLYVEIEDMIMNYGYNKIDIVTTCRDGCELLGMKIEW